jgi:hypothetical protein
MWQGNGAKRELFVPPPGGFVSTVCEEHKFQFTCVVSTQKDGALGCP